METGKQGASPSRREVIDLLRREITALQGLAKVPAEQVKVDMGRLTRNFPGGVFPTATIHEYISYTPESAASSSAFVSATVALLAQKAGASVWISRRTKVYPPALRLFGLDPAAVVFVQVASQADALWTMEEVLKTTGITAVVAEIPDLTFKNSQRLQLAVEKSKVTGFILRDKPRHLMTTAAAARWRIQPAPSYLPKAGMPGLGRTCWQVTLDRVKNGQGGSWQLTWMAGHFQEIPTAVQAFTLPAAERRAS